MTIAISRPWALTGSVLVDSVKEPRVAGFMTLANTGGPADRLVAAASPMAEKIEIHGIKVAGPDMTMRPMEKGVGLPPDTTITLKPRGYHLMMWAPKAPLAKGQRVPVTLTFEKAGARQVELVVEGEGAIGDETLYEKN
jgi:periplasmic copper chaperone A